MGFLSPKARRRFRHLPPRKRAAVKKLLVWLQLQYVTAYHEAAHVVIGYFYRLRIRRVTIVSGPASQPPAGVPAGSVGGRTEFEKPRRVTRRKAWGFVVATLAGEHGPLLFDSGTRAKDRARDHATVDRLEAKAMVPDPETFRHCEAAARALVNVPLHAQAVRDLASVLLKRKTLTGAEAYRIVKASMRRSDAG